MKRREMSIGGLETARVEVLPKQPAAAVPGDLLSEIYASVVAPYGDGQNLTKLAIRHHWAGVPEPRR